MLRKLCRDFNFIDTFIDGTQLLSLSSDQGMETRLSSISHALTIIHFSSSHSNTSHEGFFLLF